MATAHLFDMRVKSDIADNNTDRTTQTSRSFATLFFHSLFFCFCAPDGGTRTANFFDEEMNAAELYVYIWLMRKRVLQQPNQYRHATQHNATPQTQEDDSFPPNFFLLFFVFLV